MPKDKDGDKSGPDSNLAAGQDWDFKEFMLNNLWWMFALGVAGTTFVAAKTIPKIGKGIELAKIKLKEKMGFKKEPWNTDD